MGKNDLRLGIDIGGTFTKFALVKGSEIIYKTSVPTNADSPEALVSSVCEECMKIKREFDFKSVGVGTSGCITEGLVYSDNLNFFGVPLSVMLEESLGMPVAVENDANCAALGEMHFGDFGASENLVLMTIGTGIGGGVVIDGKLCRGKGAFGEIGHIIVQTKGGVPCSCGQRGCLEQYASVRALTGMAVERLVKKSDDTLFRKYEENACEMDGKIFFESLRAGSKLAHEVFDEYTDWLASGITSIINIFDPEVVVLSGGITAEREYILGALEKKVHFKTPIRISKLQNDAGCLGAAMLKAKI